MDYNTKLAIDSVARAFVTGITAGNPPATRAIGPARKTSIPASAKDEELTNYTKDQVSEDGTYTVVTEHREWIEGIPQPPTEQEIWAQEARAKRTAQVFLGFGGLVAGIGLIYFAKNRINVVVPIVPTDT